MPFQVQHSPDHGAIVVAGLIAADEQDAFEAALAKAVQELSGPVDIYYQPVSERTENVYLNAVSDRAKQFFRDNFHWNEATEGHGSYPNTKKWSHRPPTDFVFVELKPGMTLPDHAWGKRP